MGRGRGGRGRGRGRGGRAPVTEVLAAVYHTDKDLRSPPFRVFDSSRAVTVLSTKRGRGGWGKVPGVTHGVRGRGGRAAGIRRGRGQDAANVDADAHRLTTLPKGEVVAYAHGDSFSSAAPPSAISSIAAPLVVVPQGRMITRSLLRGTSFLLDDAPVESTGSLGLSLPVEGGRQRRGNPSPSQASSSASVPTDGVARHRASVAAVTTIDSLPLPPQGPTSVQRVVIGGLLRCVCNAFLVSPSETLLECCRCRNWCHPACVGVDNEDVRSYLRRRNYICPFCAPAGATTGSILSQHGSAVASPSPAAPLPSRQTASITTPLGESINVLLSPVAAPTPPLPTVSATAPANDRAAGAVVVVAVNRGNAARNGVDETTENDSTAPSTVGASTSAPSSIPSSPLLSTPTSRHPLGTRPPPAHRQIPLKLREVPDQPPPATVVQELQRLLVSVEGIAQRLGYTVLHLPEQPLTEQQVSECLACCTEAIRDATFSADYPAYCLKQVRNRRHSYVQGTVLQSSPAEGGNICSLILSSGRDLYGNLKSTITQLKSSLQRGFLEPSALSPFMAECMAIADVADFVHITLSATHVAHQRKGLARLLMTMELLKWALRGRHRAFLNMAIEKHLVDGGARIEYASPTASKRLYESFGFREVYPRYDAITKKERWTAKEADMGRVMANLDFTDGVKAMASTMPTRYPLRSAAPLSSAGANVAPRRAHAVTSPLPYGTSTEGGKSWAAPLEEVSASAAKSRSSSAVHSHLRDATQQSTPIASLRKRVGSDAPHRAEEGPRENLVKVSRNGTARQRLTLYEE